MTRLKNTRWNWFGSVFLLVSMLCISSAHSHNRNPIENEVREGGLHFKFIDQMLRVEEALGNHIASAEAELLIARASADDLGDEAADATWYAYERLLNFSRFGNLTVTCDQLVRDANYSTEQKLLILLSLHRYYEWKSAHYEFGEQAEKAIEKLLPHCRHEGLKTVCMTRLAPFKVLSLPTKKLAAFRDQLRKQHETQSSMDSSLMLEFSRVWTLRDKPPFDDEFESLIQRCEEEQRHELGLFLLSTRHKPLENAKPEDVDEWKFQLMDQTENDWLIYRIRAIKGGSLNDQRLYERSIECLSPLLNMEIHDFAYVSTKQLVLNELNHAAHRVKNQKLVEITSPRLQSSSFRSLKNSQLKKRYNDLINTTLATWESQALAQANQDDLAKVNQLLEKKQYELEGLQELLAEKTVKLNKILAEANINHDERQRAENEIAELNERIAEFEFENRALIELGRSRSRFLTWVSIITSILCLGLIGCIFLLRKRRNVQGLLERQEANLDMLNMKIARMKRMDSLGLMAGSIAHDFNNILVGVSGNAEVIELSHQKGKFDESFTLERIAAIKSAASRAQKLARQMLDYAGKQYIAHKTTNLNRLISGYQPIFESFCKDGHEVQIQLSNKKLYSKVDETQIEQAVLNLVTNAISVSMPREKIFVRTSLVSLGDDIADDPSYFCSGQIGGEFCCIEVEDFGTGIPAHQLEKIFEPYYSESGAGRGLGLAVVHGIIESHNGLIRCESVYGKGTKFQLLLPVAEPNQEDSIDTYLPNKDSKFDGCFDGKKVLVIDDELSVLDTCDQLARQFGLNPRIVHIQGEDSIKNVLDAFAEDTFDCVLMDVVMPELNATQILDVMKDREIQTPVILMSGFTPERLDFYQKREAVSKILPKPFSADQLAEAFGIAIDFGSLDDQASGNSATIKPPKFQSSTNESEKKKDA